MHGNDSNGFLGSTITVSSVTNVCFLLQDVRQVLREHTFARHALKSYEDSVGAAEECSDEECLPPSLDETQRKFVVTAIVEHLRPILSKPCHHLFPLIASKIVDVFPTESLVITIFFITFVCLV